MRPITYAIDAQGTIYIGNRVIARDNPDNPQSAADLAGLVFRANAASGLLAALEVTYTTLIARDGWRYIGPCLPPETTNALISVCEDALAVEIEAGFPDSELAGRLRAALAKAKGE